MSAERTQEKGPHDKFGEDLKTDVETLRSQIQAPLYEFTGSFASIVSKGRPFGGTISPEEKEDLEKAIKIGEEMTQKLEELKKLKFGTLG